MSEKFGNLHYTAVIEEQVQIALFSISLGTLEQTVLPRTTRIRACTVHKMACASSFTHISTHTITGQSTDTSMAVSTMKFAPGYTPRECTQPKPR